LKSRKGVGPHHQITNIKPAEQRDAWWDVEREGRETKVLASNVSGASVYRRLRHEREAPTTRANCQSVNQSKIKVPVARADTAAIPYAEISMNKINEIGR
jgi:hypothetical protein